MVSEYLGKDLLDISTIQTTRNSRVKGATDNNVRLADFCNNFIANKAIMPLGHKVLPGVKMKDKTLVRSEEEGQ